MLVEDRELTQRAARIESLLDEVESFPDPTVRDKAAEIVQGLLLLYGEGLARMLELLVERSGEAESSEILAAFADDELISHLLLVHDLHPVSVETRVVRALQEVRPYLESHGGNVEFLGVQDGVARLRLEGSCKGCPSSTMTLKLAIEEAIQRAAPDLEGIEAEGVAQPPPRPINFLPASDVLMLKQKRDVPPGPAWTIVDGAGAVDNGELRSIEVGGVPVLLLRSADSLYAYRNACSTCAAPLDRGRLQGAELSCSTCGSRYDICQAGRVLEGAEAGLQPIPLLVHDKVVKVALGGA